MPVDDDLERLVKLREAIKAERMDQNEGHASHTGGVQDEKAMGRGKQGGRKRRREDGEDQLMGSKRW